MSTNEKASLRNLSDVIYPQAEKIVIVMDNLNTHSAASFYETFEPKEARRLINRIEFHFAPKYRSWLNMAEIELGILIRQCLMRRIPDKSMLVSEVTTWHVAQYHQEYIARFYRLAVKAIILDWVRSGIKEEAETLVNQIALFLKGDLQRVFDNYKGASVYLNK